MFCSPCRRAPASSWFRCPTATSRRPTRISIKDGCTSRPPACRRSCRTTRRALPSSNRDRSPQAPDVPTAAEVGYRELTFEGTVGLYGWRDMPAALKERIAADLNAITADPAFRARVIAVGTAPRGGTPIEFAAAIEEQRAKIAAIHRATEKKSAQ